MKQTTMNTLTIVVIAICVFSAAYAITEPEGPTTLNITNSTRRTPVSATSLPAQSGNVTQLVIHGNTISQTWAGFYGNVSGKLTLDDASNNTLYDWTMTRPSGEVYASEYTINWSTGNIDCWDMNFIDNMSYESLSEYETYLGLYPNDADGVNETFTFSNRHRSFYAGGNFIDGGLQRGSGGKACANTRLYNSTGQASEEFQEIMLYDYTARYPFYAALIEPTPVIGFDNRPWDFEMIVGANGHNGSTSLVTYYFYVELG